VSFQDGNSDTSTVGSKKSAEMSINSWWWSQEEIGSVRSQWGLYTATEWIKSSDYQSKDRRIFFYKVSCLSFFRRPHPLNRPGTFTRPAYYSNSSPLSLSAFSTTCSIADFDAWFIIGW